jgi:hypothetical protein
VDELDENLQTLKRKYPHLFAAAIRKTGDPDRAWAIIDHEVRNRVRGKKGPAKTAAETALLGRMDNQARTAGVDLAYLKVVDSHLARGERIETFIERTSARADRVLRKLPPKATAKQRAGAFVRRFIPRRGHKDKSEDHGPKGGGGQHGGDAWVGTDTREPSGTPGWQKWVIIIMVILGAFMLLVSCASLARNMGWEPGLPNLGSSARDDVEQVATRQPVVNKEGTPIAQVTKEPGSGPSHWDLDELHNQIAESVKADEQGPIGMMAQYDRPKFTGPTGLGEIAKKYQEQAVNAWKQLEDYYGLIPGGPEGQVVKLIRGPDGTLDTLVGIGDALAQDQPDWEKAKTLAAKYEELDGKIRQQLDVAGITVEGDPLSVVPIIEKWEKNLKPQPTPKAAAPEAPASNGEAPPVAPGPSNGEAPSAAPPSFSAPPAAAPAPAAPGAPVFDVPVQATPVPQPAQAAPQQIQELYTYNGVQYSLDGAKGVVQARCGAMDEASMNNIIANAKVAGNRLDGFVCPSGPKAAGAPAAPAPAPVQGADYRYNGQALTTAQASNIAGNWASQAQAQCGLSTYQRELMYTLIWNKIQANGRSLDNLQLPGCDAVRGAAAPTPIPRVQPTPVPRPAPVYPDQALINAIQAALNTAAAQCRWSAATVQAKGQAAYNCAVQRGTVNGCLPVCTNPPPPPTPVPRVAPTPVPQAPAMSDQQIIDAIQAAVNRCTNLTPLQVQQKAGTAYQCAKARGTTSGCLPTCN